MCAVIVNDEVTDVVETETGFTSNDVTSPDGPATESVTSPLKPFSP
jgi:hypothetical protein